MGSIDHDWTSTTFRDALLAVVRRRVPERDAEDVVQTVLAEALSSPHRPAEPGAARKWLWGVARNKIADYHRRARREELAEPEGAAVTDDADVRALLRWALGELPEGADAARTFEWLVRESEGEKLEDIARAEQLSAAQVRQRVSRLRRFFRSRWALHAAAALALVAALAYIVLRRPRGAPRPRVPGPAVFDPPEIAASRERARALRASAARACDASRWVACLADLDAARELDPRGDAAPEVTAARRRAIEGLERERARPADASAPDARRAAPVFAPVSDRDGDSVLPRAAPRRRAPRPSIEPAAPGDGGVPARPALPTRFDSSANDPPSRLHRSNAEFVREGVTDALAWLVAAEASR